MITAPKEPSVTCLFKRMFYLIGLVSISFFLPPPALAADIIIGAGQSGTFENHTAMLLCRIIERGQEDFSCSVQESDDTVDMLTNVQGGSLDLALIDSYLLNESLTRKGPFAYLGISHERIRIITPLYQRPMTLLARNDAALNTIDELPGKRINSGPPGSYQQRLFGAIITAHGWSSQDFALLSELSATLSQDKLSLKQGNVQILFHYGVHPDPGLQRLLTESQVRLIGFNDPKTTALAKNNPAFTPVTINGQTYTNIAVDIRTIGTTMVLVTSSDMDDNTARAIASVLRENQHLVQNAHPVLADFKLGGKPEWFGGIKQHSAVQALVTNQ